MKLKLGFEQLPQESEERDETAIRMVIKEIWKAAKQLPFTKEIAFFEQIKQMTLSYCVTWFMALNGVEQISGLTELGLE